MLPQVPVVPDVCVVVAVQSVHAVAVVNVVAVVLSSTHTHRIQYADKSFDLFQIYQHLIIIYSVQLQASSSLFCEKITRHYQKV